MRWTPAATSSIRRTATSRSSAASAPSWAAATGAFTLATRCGCPDTLPGLNASTHEWTRDNLFRGLEIGLKRLNRASVDVIQLHNPGVAECEAGGLVDALPPVVLETTPTRTIPDDELDERPTSASTSWFAPRCESREGRSSSRRILLPG